MKRLLGLLRKRADSDILDIFVLSAAVRMNAAVCQRESVCIQSFTDADRPCKFLWLSNKKYDTMIYNKGVSVYLESYERKQ